MNTLEIDTLLKKHPSTRNVFKGVYARKSMNEVKNAMMSAHGRSFLLYSNGIVSPMKAMFVHEIDISGFMQEG
jgi:hypothetical protein